jgi:hypothetical protein
MVNVSPLGRETLISLLRHFGIDRLKIDFPIEVFWLLDSELLVVLLNDCVSDWLELSPDEIETFEFIESEIPELEERLLPEDKD